MLTGMYELEKPVGLQIMHIKITRVVFFYQGKL